MVVRAACLFQSNKHCHNEMEHIVALLQAKDLLSLRARSIFVLHGGQFHKALFVAADLSY